MNFLVAFILALIITSILAFLPANRRGDPSVIPVTLFFIILFMAGIAAEYWIIPFGPLFWGVYWLPVLFIILVISLLLSAPPLYHRRVTKTEGRNPADPSSANVSTLVWLFASLLLIAILVGLFRKPAY
jgi:hypothetical protein